MQTKTWKKHLNPGVGVLVKPIFIGFVSIVGYSGWDPRLLMATLGIRQDSHVFMSSPRFDDSFFLCGVEISWNLHFLCFDARFWCWNLNDIPIKFPFLIVKSPWNHHQFLTKTPTKNRLAVLVIVLAALGAGHGAQSGCSRSCRSCPWCLANWQKK